MYKKVLVEREIRDGARLLEELDRRGFDVSACFWYDVPDSPRWRLIIASKIVDREGSLRGYELLDQVERDVGFPNSFEVQVSLLSPDDPSFKRIRDSVTTASLVDAGYKGGGDSGLALDDAYFYRL
ncbi:MAG: hypothetical protein ACR2NN_17720 [Bryobacteraceae bacterium]